jgi:GT2 family glycosyltransferase
MSHHVAIVILNWRSSRETIECLESLDTMDHRDWRAYVVDNESTDESQQALRALASDRITVLESPINLGYTGGCNLGMQQALKDGADFIWLLNNDAVVEASCLSTLLAAARQHPEAGVLSPVVRYFDAPGRTQFCGAVIDRNAEEVIYPDSMEQFLGWQNDRPDQVVVWGTAMLIRGAVARRIGTLDDRLFAYWEDTDYCVRTQLSGSRCRLVADAAILHRTAVPGTGTRPRPPHFFYYMVRNEWLFWARHSLRAGPRLRARVRLLGKSVAERSRCLRLQPGQTRVADACLHGLWHAWIGITGPYVPGQRPMPALLLRMLSALPWRVQHWLATR